MLQKYDNKEEKYVTILHICMYLCLFVCLSFIFIYYLLHKYQINPGPNRLHFKQLKTFDPGEQIFMTGNASKK